MLKNVVLPAPLGPMIETIDCSRDAERDVVDGHQAAEELRDVASASSTAAGAAAAALGAGAVLAASLTRAPRRRDSSLADALGELDLASSLGQQALGPQHHHDHEQEAEDPEAELVRSKSSPSLLGTALSTSGISAC